MDFDLLLEELECSENLFFSLENIQSDLGCAQSCETKEDLVANLKAAKANAQTLVKELDALLKAAK